MHQDFIQIEALENELIQESTKKDAQRLSELLADDFEEIGKSGKVYCREDYIASIPNSTHEKISLQGFRFKKLSETVVFVKYISCHESCKAFRSSIWVKSGDAWKLLHHQGTLCE